MIPLHSVVVRVGLPASVNPEHGAWSGASPHYRVAVLACRGGGGAQVAREVEVGMGQPGNGEDAGGQDRAGKQANSWVCAVSPPTHSCSGSAQD